MTREIGSKLRQSSITSHKTRGFTLIEILAALFLVSLILAIAIPKAGNLFLQEQIRGTARKLELFAKTARTRALNEQQPYRLFFEKNSFMVEPLTKEKKEGFRTSYRLPGGVLSQMRSWNEKGNWKKMDKLNWIFQPTGICEPLYFRFSKENAWLEMEFNPLTASSQNESFSFP